MSVFEYHEVREMKTVPNKEDSGMGDFAEIFTSFLGGFGKLGKTAEKPVEARPKPVQNIRIRMSKRHIIRILGGSPLVFKTPDALITVELEDDNVPTS